MSFEYIQKAYGVPAERGRRVVAYGKPGVIVGAHGHYIRVVLDGEQHDGNYHPTCEVQYGDMGELPPVAKRWKCLAGWRDWHLDSEYIFEVMAPTRSKARYQAFLELRDCYDLDRKALLGIQVRAA